MSSAFRRNFLILWSDLLIALSAFWLARYFGDMPRWYWLVLSAVVWGAGRSVAQVTVRCIQEDTLCVSGNLRAGRTFGAVPLHPVPALRARLRIRLFHYSCHRHHHLCSNGRLCPMPSDGWFTGKSLSSTKSTLLDDVTEVGG